MTKEPVNKVITEWAQLDPQIRIAHDGLGVWNDLASFTPNRLADRWHHTKIRGRTSVGRQAPARSEGEALLTGRRIQFSSRRLNTEYGVRTDG